MNPESIEAVEIDPDKIGPHAHGAVSMALHAIELIQSCREMVIDQSVKIGELGHDPDNMPVEVTTGLLDALTEKLTESVLALTGVEPPGEGYRSQIISTGATSTKEP